MRIKTSVMKQIQFFLLALTVCLLTACSSNDDEASESQLLRKWDLEEVQNGPVGKCQQDYAESYPSGTVTIEFKGNGKIDFNYADGKAETLDYAFPEDQEKYLTDLSVLTIGEVPFGYTIEGNRLKLHYLGFYFCDHIPATFVFTRTR